MLTIGELAGRAGVSVRMLHHYDRLGLITPVHVDAATGYRRYAPSQLGRVVQVKALRDLGFSLDECGVLLDNTVPAPDLRALLVRRRDEVSERVAADTRRLTDLDRRLESIDRGLLMSAITLRLGDLPAFHFVHVRTTVRTTTDIGEALGELRERLAVALADAGLQPPGPRVHTYYGRPDGVTIDVAAGYALDAAPAGRDGWPDDLLLHRVAAEPEGATVTHSGPGADVADAWSTFDVALAERGLRAHGLHRQVQRSVDEASGTVVVDLQCPVRARDACP